MRIYAREVAFSKIYGYLLSNCAVDDDALFFDMEKLNEEDKLYFNKLYISFVENQTTVFETVKNCVAHYTLERVNKLDLAIICVAVCDIRYLDTPPAVSINEAVSIAKKFSSADSPSFVNGVLGEFVKQRSNNG